MSTVKEIESAIERLPVAEQARLRDWLLKLPLPLTETRPKTGAELAALWPAMFHLTSQEADELARDLETAHSNQHSAKAPSWE